MTNLQELKVAELKEIAKGLGIALSYTDNGKRHTLNKTELITAIETKQADQVTNEVTPETNEQEISLVTLNEVIPFTLNKIKEINCINELNEFKQKLFATFNSKQQTKKRTLKSKWALQYNRLCLIFKQYENKLHHELQVR